jgi:hypothetical protein
MTTEVTLGEIVHEARGYFWFAAFAVLLGLILIFLELRSTDVVIWTGHCVPASFDGGIAHYQVDGQAFTADNPPVLDPTVRNVTVCYASSEPANGYIVRRAAYWVEGGMMGGPIALAAVLVLVGLLRSASNLRRHSTLPPLPTRRL